MLSDGDDERSRWRVLLANSLGCSLGNPWVLPPRKAESCFLISQELPSNATSCLRLAHLKNEQSSSSECTEEDEGLKLGVQVGGKRGASRASMQ